MECIICPICRHHHEEWWEYLEFEKDEQKFEMNCEHCDWLFIVNVHVERTFTSSDFVIEDFLLE